MGKNRDRERRSLLHMVSSGIFLTNMECLHCQEAIRWTADACLAEWALKSTSQIVYASNKLYIR